MLCDLNRHGSVGAIHDITTCVALLSLGMPPVSTCNVIGSLGLGDFDVLVKRAFHHLSRI